MPHLAIPHRSSSGGAEIWVAALDEPEAPSELRVGGAVHPVPAAWQRWTSPDGSLALRHQRVAIAGLAERRRYPVELRVAGRLCERCEVKTLPARLPAAGEHPLVVMLGSCFCRLTDEQGSTGMRYARLPGGARPDLNILCGDQVYLDSPWPRFLVPIRRDPLTRALVENYWQTWSQSGGFQEILRRGPTWFLGDDHEYWNNAPNGSVWPCNSLAPGPRAYWLGLARTLFQAFQSPASVARLTVPPLSFFFADTRINREEGRKRFMAPGDLAVLGAWLDGLEAPGVLVIGQPVFASPGSLKERLSDLGLPDFEQYAELVEILHRARHSVVVLTGDVHFGRIARCSLASGGELIEIISSPLALVSEGAGKKWRSAPERFPAADLGLPPARVETERDFQEWQDHFLTLEFQAVGREVSLRVNFWPIGGTGSRCVFSHHLR